MKVLTEGEWLQRMAAYCTSSERCPEEVRLKLHESGMPEELVRHIITRLIEEKFIDEARYCRSFVNDKLRLNRWGRIKIAIELRHRRLPVPLIADSLASIDTEEYEAILISVLKEKSKTVRGRDAREHYYKLLRFATSRGFESAIVGTCLRSLGVSFYDDETTVA
ncbi:MAG: RecX family transcriptional regulator [Tannerellaceae bacterium]|jgi:regulatory protein|nr:RecX family transcriptional regulator [Tannerellaceae bacterium]